MSKHDKHDECCVATVRKPAPNFKTNSYYKGNFKEISLKDFSGKWVVLFFWPLDFTFVCPTEIIAYSNKSKEFVESDAQLIGCSIDSVFSHMEWTKKARNQGGLGEMDMPMLSDIGGKISKSYGCLIDQGGDAGVAFRATYIIDPNGILRHISISDLSVGRNPDETLRLLKAFQFADKHGEVCPAKWTPGAKTLETNPNSKKNMEVWNTMN